jgi:hypothetical protein
MHRSWRFTFLYGCFVRLDIRPPTSTGETAATLYSFSTHATDSRGLWRLGQDRGLDTRSSSSSSSVVAILLSLLSLVLLFGFLGVLAAAWAVHAGRPGLNTFPFFFCFSWALASVRWEEGLGMGMGMGIPGRRTYNWTGWTGLWSWDGMRCMDNLVDLLGLWLGLVGCQRGEE